MPWNILIYFSFETSKVVTSLVSIVIFSTQFVRFTVHNLRSLDTLVSHGFGDPSITVRKIQGHKRTVWLQFSPSGQ